MVLRHGAGGAPTTLVCGEARFDNSATSRLAELLPGVLLLRARSPRRASWERSTFTLIASEARRVRPGGETVMTRLADVLVIQAIRSWVERDPAALHGWLGALRDPQIGLAISLMHREPAAQADASRTVRAHGGASSSASSGVIATDGAGLAAARALAARAASTSC